MADTALRERIRSTLSRVSPTYLIIAATLPLLIYLFSSSEVYNEALRFILGVGDDAPLRFRSFVSVLSISAAGVLGFYWLTSSRKLFFWFGAFLVSLHLALFIGMFAAALAIFLPPLAIDPREAIRLSAEELAARREAHELRQTFQVRIGSWLYTASAAVALALAVLVRRGRERLEFLYRPARTLVIGANALLLAWLLVFADLGFADGVFTTIRATVLSYIAASILGLVLAGLLILKLSSYTVLRYGLAGLLLLGASLVFFLRPTTSYVLAGDESGRVAIIQGTPARLSAVVKSGAYDPGGGTIRSIRGVNSVEEALDRLESGIVSAVFVPEDAAPAGAPVLWQVSFLPENLRNTGLALLVLGALILLLSFGAWISEHHPLAIFAELYVDLLRGIPMLVVILYVGFNLQGALRDVSGGAIELPRLTRGIIAISLGYAAYMAEIFRAGIEAISKGQVEASRSLGLSGWQTARFVVLPQALRIVVPPLGNEFIAMLKDTSLLSIISVRDITQRTREFQADTLQSFPAFNTVALLYIGLTLAASSLVRWFERRSKVGER